MRRATGFVLLAVAAALISGCSGGDKLKVGDAAPEFSLPDTTGSTVSLDEYGNGKPVLLYFHMAVG